jgi:hypothetical protein
MTPAAISLLLIHLKRQTTNAVTARAVEGG